MMETIRGKTSHELNFSGLRERLASYNQVLLDLGTGDGRYVRYLAEHHPRWFVIGVDTCRENLHKHSRAKLPNALFIIAAAQDLPHELRGLSSHLTINFPWGSLLDGLLTADPALMGGLASVSGCVASLDIRLNGGALAEAGTTLEAGAGKIRDNLFRSGWPVKDPVTMDSCALRTFPSTWASRLAFGRDPRAMTISGGLTNPPVDAK
jgi:methyltransferase family protein